VFHLTLDTKQTFKPKSLYRPRILDFLKCVKKSKNDAYLAHVLGVTVK